MYAVRHALLKAKSGEKVRINFTVTDQAGAPINLASATAVYRIARRIGETHLLEASSAGGNIVFAGNLATVTFDVTAVTQGGQQQFGDFFGQLFITKDGNTLVAAEGPINISDVIQ